METNSTIEVPRRAARKRYCPQNTHSVQEWRAGLDQILKHRDLSFLLKQEHPSPLKRKAIASRTGNRTPSSDIVNGTKWDWSLVPKYYLGQLCQGSPRTVLSTGSMITHLGDALRGIHPITAALKISDSCIVSCDCVLSLYVKGSLTWINYFHELGCFRNPVDLLADMNHLLRQRAIACYWPGKCPRLSTRSANRVHLLFPTHAALISTGGAPVVDLFHRYMLDVRPHDVCVDAISRQSNVNNPLVFLKRVGDRIPEADIQLSCEELESSLFFGRAFSKALSRGREPVCTGSSQATFASVSCVSCVC